MLIPLEMLATISAIFLSFLFSFLSMPYIIKKMLDADFCGIDVNKKNKPKIPEMGGIAGVLGFSLGITTTLGVVKLIDNIDEVPVLVSISILGIAAFIGIMDDISILRRKEKALLIIFASFPLIISQIGDNVIDLILYQIDFAGRYRLIFWIVLVPIAITGCSNAMNMSAGYNGLESGHIMIVSFTLLIISTIKNVDISITIIFAGIFGSMFAIFLFNRYPAKIFVGDVGTLSFGAVLGAAVIMSGLAIYGVICILPAFYELYATIKYKIKGIERRDACMNPLISDNGLLSIPPGTEDYTLAFFILSKKERSEKDLVKLILGLYLFSSIFSFALFLNLN